MQPMRQSLPARASQCYPAIDDERLTRDVARLLGREEPHGVADIPAGSLDTKW